MPTSASYKETVLPIIKKVRAKLLPHYGKVEFRNKPGRTQDVITDLDIAIEQFYKKAFSKHYPDISFVGEETGGDRSAERFWLVDPIDGTEYFIRGMPFCTTQVALVERGEVVFSVVYDFVNDILYSAQKHCGATANGIPSRVSERRLREGRLCWSMKLDKAENLEKFAMLSKCTYLFHVGPSGYECAMIASGKLEGLVYRSPSYNDYDVAPGTLLIREAGGVVANIGSRGYDYRNLNFIAANPRVFRELTEGPNALFPIRD